uniref:Uncharacterized protein n=1 Tax=Lactuca sativa TaxID=4236 RepID=A0A9R1W978_LACSA|nr:hypothetical protein LSAT_V11C300130270 [Lactuca sativa]
MSCVCLTSKPLQNMLAFYEIDILRDWYSVRIIESSILPATSSLPSKKQQGGCRSNPHFQIYFYDSICNDDQETEVQFEVHVESPLRNINHVNDETMGEYMSLILFGHKIDALRGRIRSSQIEIGEGSCSKRLNLDDIDALKEKTAD